jgi:hypothetical protein
MRRRTTAVVATIATVAVLTWPLASSTGATWEGDALLAGAVLVLVAVYVRIHLIVSRPAGTPLRHHTSLPPLGIAALAVFAHLAFAPLPVAEAHEESHRHRRWMAPLVIGVSGGRAAGHRPADGGPLGAGVRCGRTGDHELGSAPHRPVGRRLSGRTPPGDGGAGRPLDRQLTPVPRRPLIGEGGGGLASPSNCNIPIVRLTSSYPALRLGPYRGWWRRAVCPTAARKPMNWIIAVPLLAVTFVCASIPVLMESGRRH